MFGNFLKYLKLMGIDFEDRMKRSAEIYPPLQKKKNDSVTQLK